MTAGFASLIPWGRRRLPDYFHLDLIEKDLIDKPDDIFKIEGSGADPFNKLGNSAGIGKIGI